jgi:hypothetical protein
VWALSRRTGLFFVSYVPLAVMFMLLKWPAGWTAGQLIKLGLVLAAVVALVLLIPALVAVTGSVARWMVSGTSFVAVAAAVTGILNGWLAPMALHVARHRTSAATAGIAFAFATLGLLTVALLLYNARRSGTRRWHVTDPRHQGAAVAGYLATYLLPLLAVQPGGWRVTAAYAVYLVVMYLVYIKSDDLVLINPTLYVFGYRIYDVAVTVSTDPSTQQRVLLLTRLRLTGDTDVNVLPLGGDNHLAFEMDADDQLETN